MVRPIDLQFEDISMSQDSFDGSQDSQNTFQKKPLGALKGGQKKKNWWREHLENFRQKVGVSGSAYNILTFTVVTFVATFILLVCFRPPLVMNTPKPTPENPNPDPCISWTSILIWSGVMAAAVAGVSFFTRPKSSPEYVMEK